MVGKALPGTFPNKQAYEKNKAAPKLIMDFYGDRGLFLEEQL